MLALVPGLFPDFSLVLQPYFHSLAKALEQMKHIFKCFLFYFRKECSNLFVAICNSRAVVTQFSTRRAAAWLSRSLGTRVAFGALAAPGSEHVGSCPGGVFFSILVHCLLDRGGVAHRLSLRPKLAWYR